MMTSVQFAEMLDHVIEQVDIQLEVLVDSYNYLSQHDSDPFAAGLFGYEYANLLSWPELQHELHQMIHDVPEPPAPEPATGLYL